MHKTINGGKFSGMTILSYMPDTSLRLFNKLIALPIEDHRYRGLFTPTCALKSDKKSPLLEWAV
jgi:hypothetical protein